ncbi:MAG: InlB B-repeat-containing protein [Blautia wexlerae]
MYRKRHKRGKRLASVFLTVALITATVPVQAAEFGTPDSFEEIFSSGEEDSCITDTENTLPAASDSEKVMASELSPTPTVTSTPEGTPALTETPTPSVTPMPSSTPTPSVTPSPSPTPTINPEKEVMLRFIDGEGNECEQLRTVMSWGESLILPNVPDTGAPDMWKLEKNEKLGDAITLKGGDILTLKKGESWNLFLEKGILNFYMPKKCTVSLYNNSGTSVFSNGILQAYETKNVILPDMPSSKYINYGWTDTKGSSAVKYELNSEFTVTGDTDFYIVRRTALQVNFKTNTGASNSKFTRLNQKVGKGLTVTMPQVPVKTGYQSLGWSKNKKASKADYKAGQNVTVSKTLTLYAVYKKLPYTVTFNNNNGTSTSKIYTSLTMYASKNQKVTLPDVPKVKGYTNLGWTTEREKQNRNIQPVIQ